MPGWLTDIFGFWISGTMALNPERQSARKSKTKNDRLANLASNPGISVAILKNTWAMMG